MNLSSLVPWRNDKTLAPTIREDFFDPFVTFRREVDRMFDDFLAGFGDARPAATGRQGVTPVVDVEETDKELIIAAELPGVDEKDVDVTLSGDVLTIKGEKKAARGQNNADGYHAERRFGAFSRSVRLPFEVKDENVEARFDKGVLTVRVPKPAEIQKAVRRIDVKAA